MPIAEDVPPVISNHPGHPAHKLKRVATDDRFFTCAGCKELGAGTRYRCEHERCDFELHTCCAVWPPTLTHPLFGDHVFVFLLEPAATTGAGKGRACDACCEAVRGFAYHCFDADLDLHPCCARLPVRTHRDGRVFALRQDISGDANHGPRETIRPAAARHRRWAAPQAAVRAPPPQNNLRVGSVFEVRQEASRPCDTSGDRNRGREIRPAAARHRRWKP